MGDIDDTEFQARLLALAAHIQVKKMDALRKVGNEVLRLSEIEVPFKTGHLQNTGSVHEGDDEVIVGYNTQYAAYVHEGKRADGTHVIKNYSNGRKGHYLRDPIQHNLQVFRVFLSKEMSKL